jgi:8-amino-7-oxononanoate synthase
VTIWIEKKIIKTVLNFYSAAIQSQKEKNLYRSLATSNAVAATTIRRGAKKLTSFCCNDYLALSQNSQVKNAAIAAIKKFGVGARASRYVTGNNSLYEKLEKQIAKMKNCSDSIVFSSGYAAAIGVVSALVAEGDLILMDRLMHSSAIDGAKLSGARLMRFFHNDVSHAKKILQENRHKFKKCLIVTETVFSMDGDVGEVFELLKLAQEFDAILLSDAAHDLFLKNGLQVRPRREDGVTILSEVTTVGKVTTVSEVANVSEGANVGEVVVGEVLNVGEVARKNVCHFTHGRHLTQDCHHGRHLTHNCHPVFTTGSSDLENYLQLGTLSKAVGTLGGYVAGDKILINYLRNFAKSAIYSTALPPAILAASLASLKIIEKKNFGQKALENAQYFCELMNLPKPESAIVPIILGENKKTLAAAKKLEERGFLVSAIRPPTVEAGKARLRITFSSAHKKSQIKKLAQVLQVEVFLGKK